MNLLAKFREAIDLVDLNCDGVPDVEQGWMVELAWQGALHLARTHLEEHHPVRIAMEAGELVKVKIQSAAAGELVEAPPVEDSA